MEGMGEAGFVPERLNERFHRRALMRKLRTENIMAGSSQR